MSDKKLRAWCLKANFPGKAQFYFGTAYLPFEAMQHEVDQALADAWAEIFPFAAPDNAIAIPGMVLFVPKNDGAA